MRLRQRDAKPLGSAIAFLHLAGVVAMLMSQTVAHGTAFVTVDPSLLVMCDLVLHLGNHDPERTV